MAQQQTCNKTDYSKVEVSEDKVKTFESLFALQKVLIEKIHEKRPSSLIRVVNGVGTEEEGIEWAMNMIACMHNELEEVREWYPWKSWKQYKDFKINHTEIKYELIDLLHFLLEFMLILGMTPKETLQIFYSKMEQNHERQDNGY